MVNISVDYIEKAINWLGNQPNVDTKKIGMVGTSKGGELALLSASIFPAIKAVAGYAPSSVVYPGISQNNSSSSSWKYKGEELPYAKGKAPEKVGSVYREKYIKRRAYHFSGLVFPFDGRTNECRNQENINGPVLLISGGDDQLWPPDIMSDRVIERLGRKNHPYYYEHVTYPGAGHYFVAPGMPTTDSDKIAFASGFTMLLGANPHDNAVAHAKA
ncbi:MULTISPECIES: acyl-CoA thioester hydrolase/BAAT C-terminal domain-containing protein [Oceanobacillus]|uniref:Acyl-CoA thioester hydrolase/BAAT C-terminal domain-containing protein n=1 Tax=Oceanobacillus aidingensis TaxID=645964 RepID=A0ABV9K1G7_9BACI|nr:acyl-CoA thioester hydrolase/BAAT C-terminal domain-containing protein [Oceanobacillus oncorhynchi]MDM8101806.1 acyl-CoA thioester hydrolase/BAAT C-terminal domain-containing protein [Oceanobacillus oncorhynchi]